MASGSTTSRKSAATVVQQVVDAIRNGVRDGIYAPGQRLIEADLTAMLGVSRGPLREALGRLASEGLLVIEPHRGAVVRKLSRREVGELFEVRELLEGQAARLAAERIDDSDHRARIENLLVEVRDHRSDGDPLSYMAHNSRFHDTIFAVSENRLLARIASQLHTQTYRLQFNQLIRSEAARHQSNDDHVQILEAILAGNAQTAERIMRRHVRRSGNVTAAFRDTAFG
jgi:DNA-binding GntR family transcriptional regulator